MALFKARADLGRGFLARFQSSVEASKEEEILGRVVGGLEVIQMGTERISTGKSA